MELVRSATVLLELTVAPLPLMMCWMVPVPPSETVTMSFHWTPDEVGDASAFALTTLGMTLKKQYTPRP